MKKKIRARILITGYEDPVDGLCFDLKFDDGDNYEIIALLFKSAVTFGRKELHMSNDQIIELFTGCAKLSGDKHD